MVISDYKEWTLCKLRGRMDSFNLEQLKSQFLATLDNGSQKLALDLENVDFVNLPMIRYLIELNQQLQARAGEVVLVCPNPTVAKHLDVYASRTGLRIFKDKDSFDRGEVIASKALYKNLPNLGL